MAASHLRDAMLDIATISGTPDTTPRSVPTSEVLPMLARQGVVLFRGFDCDLDEFIALTKQYSHRFTRDPMKDGATPLLTAGNRLGDAARLLARVRNKLPNALASRRRDDDTRAAPFDGGYGINVHNENTFIPEACPDLVWFWCRTPSTDGGASLLCDGVDVLADLSPDAVRFLEERPLRFEVTFDRTRWRAVFGVDSEDELTAMLDGRDDVTYSISRSGRLSYAYDTTQIGHTMFDRRRTVRSNVLSRRGFDEVGENEIERTADGEQVPAWFVRELLEVTGAHRQEVDLLADDVLLIDNSRVMHGRTPFTDENRRVLTRCSWLEQDLLATVRS